MICVVGAGLAGVSAARALLDRGLSVLLVEDEGASDCAWDGAVLPFPDDEFDRWPFPGRDLAPHYGAVAARLGVAAPRGELDDLFPFHAPPAPPENASPKAELVLARLRARAKVLAEGGVRFGRARLAAAGAEQELEDLEKRKGFKLRRGLRVLRVEPRGAGARVHAAGAGGEERLDADRVVLAAGALATARVVLASLDAFGRELSFRFQPAFTAPAVMLRRGPAEPDGATSAAQVFLELRDKSVSRRLVHLQFHGALESLDAGLKRASSWAGPLARPLRRRLARRFAAVRGFLHSEDSPEVAFRAARDGHGARLELSRPELSAVRRRAATAARALLRRSRDLRFAPLPPLLRLEDPSDGARAAAVFPMRVAPGELQTDRLGRLAALPNVHLADASVLPSVAASTLGFTVAANARRIASELAA